jgi:hypothetical protein
MFAPPIVNSLHDSPTKKYSKIAIKVQSFDRPISSNLLFQSNGDIFSRLLWPEREKTHWLRWDFPHSVNNGNILIRESSNHPDTSSKSHVYSHNIACGYILHSFLYKFGTWDTPSNKQMDR